MALAASVLVTAEAKARLFEGLLLSTTRFTLVSGAVQHAYQAVQAAPSTNLLRQFIVDFSEVLV